MFSSLLSIVDSVLTLDEGCSRKDILSGDQVVIDGNLNKSVSGRISGAASLVCIHGVDKSKKFYVIVGKNKLELQGSMDMNPKPLSMVCPTHKSVRVTNDNNKYFEIRFSDAVSFSAWLSALGEALAESMCSEVLVAQASNRIVCSNMRRCIHTCELLTSPSKVYIRRVNEIYGIRRKLLEVMSTLRSNPCDVNMKDLRSLKELCLKFPELRADPDMKFLLERMPSDRYNSEDLQVILKDILYAESDDAGVVCAQVYHGASTDSILHDSNAAVASAVMVNESCTSLSPTLMSEHLQSSATSGEALSSISSQSSSNGVSAETAKAAMQVHKKSRIVLNGVEIQSSARSPSSAGKALSKQIKIKSKFLTPSQRKEPARPKSKSKTPPQSMNILSEIKYNVASPDVLDLFGSPAVGMSHNKIFTPVPTAPLDKENLPAVNRNITPAPRNSAFKKPASVLKSTPVASMIPVRTKLPTPGVQVSVEVKDDVVSDGGDDGSGVPARVSCCDVVEMTVVQEDLALVLNTSHNLISSEPQLPCEPPVPQEITIDLIPHVEQRQSHCGSPVKATTSVPFFSPPRDSSSLIPNVANLFDNAVVFAVSVQEPNLAAMDALSLRSPVVDAAQMKKDVKTSEKQSAVSKFKASLIPAYEVPLSKVMPLSTQLATKPSRLPVAVERGPVSPVAEPTMSVCPEASAEQVANEISVEVEVKELTVEETPAAPALSETCPIAATPVAVRPQPAQLPETQPSVMRESRGKKSSTAPSLMSPNAKPLRAKHFTPSRDTVGTSGTAPRTPALAPVMVPSSTPAQAKTPTKSLTKTPIKAASPSPASVVSQKSSSALEKPQVGAKRADLDGKVTSSRTSIFLAAIAFFVIVCAFYASGTMSTDAPVAAPAPLVQVPIAQVVAQQAILAASSESIAPPTPVEANRAQGESEFSATPESSPTFAKISGFEMHVRFKGAASLPQSASVPPATQLSQQNVPSAHSPQRPHALQRHSSSALHAHLRTLQRLLSMPVKVFRSLFGRALQKFERIRKVLAE